MSGQSSALHLQWAQHSQCSQPLLSLIPLPQGSGESYFPALLEKARGVGFPQFLLSGHYFPTCNHCLSSLYSAEPRTEYLSVAHQGPSHRWALAEVEMTRLPQNAVIVTQEPDCLGPTQGLPAQPWIKHFPIPAIPLMLIGISFPWTLWADSAKWLRHPFSL